MYYANDNYCIYLLQFTNKYRIYKEYVSRRVRLYDIGLR